MLPPRTVRTTPELYLADRQGGKAASRGSAAPRPAPAATVHWKPPFRLRHLLTVALAGGALGTVVPRVRAAWELHDLASVAADYAACMVGPTGPQLIREDRREFQRLVRRRLVAAPADDAPFARCAALASQLSTSENTVLAHRAAARDFVEYGADAPRPKPRALAELAFELTPLAERAEQAWPFVRGGYSRLVRLSLGAKEAPHPVAPAAAGVGRGLPNERALPKRSFATPGGLWVRVGDAANGVEAVSQDGGITFRRGRAEHAQEPMGECGGGELPRGFRVGSREDGALLVTSFVPNREPVTQTAVTREHRLLTLSCDDAALVAAFEPEGGSNAELVLCSHERGCAPLEVPARAPFSPLTVDGFDIARVAGATVLVVERKGIVRVVSTRDDGRTWTPSTVAFDAGDVPPLQADAPVPTRLLGVGSRLFLYGAARRARDSYALLISDDQGASFRSPGEISAPQAAIARRAAR